MSHPSFLALSLAAAAGGAWSAAAYSQVCQPHWERGAAVAPDGGVHALAAISEGGGISLYVGGRFTHIGGVPADHVAKWDGSAWTALGSGIPGQFNSHGFNGCCANVHSIAAGVSGSSVIIAGNFVTAGGQIVESIADYSGGVWQSLAGGIANAGCVDCAYVVYTTARAGSAASGPIYAAGTFDLAGGNPAAKVARWDGQSWSALGTGIGAATGDPFPAVVQALATFQGSLYAAGTFTRAGSIETRGIARWNGAEWSDVGGGLGVPAGGRIPSVTAMAVYDNGQGASLYIAGIMDEVGGVPARNIAKWDGAAWSPVGSGIGTGVNDRVWTLNVFDDGSGPALYAGGEFADAGGLPAANIARWNGSAWSAVGDGVDGAVQTMAVRDTSLYVGGWFATAGGVSSPFLAKWAGCPSCYANCDRSTASPTLNVSDFVCFMNSYSAGAAYANCDASSLPPVLNVADFICFLNRFAAGCE